MARILVADDHIVVAEGIVKLLSADFEAVEMVGSGEALLKRVEAGDIDLVVADISMQEMSGMDALCRLRSIGYLVPFLFVTMHEDPTLAAEALRRGAKGYVVKSEAGEELLRAASAVLGGETYVTARLAAQVISGLNAIDVYKLTSHQKRVIRRVAQGLRPKQIAYELGVSVRTIESHKSMAMQILDVHTTIELVRRAEALGILLDVD